MLCTQWRELRGLRLEMLADSPLAYVEALESAERLTDVEWQERAIRYTRPGCCALVAVDDAASGWIGTMSAYVDHSVRRPYLSSPSTSRRSTAAATAGWPTPCWTVSSAGPGAAG